MRFLNGKPARLLDSAIVIQKTTVYFFLNLNYLISLSESSPISNAMNIHRIKASFENVIQIPKHVF